MHRGVLSLPSRTGPIGSLLPQNGEKPFAAPSRKIIEAGMTTGLPHLRHVVFGLAIRDASIPP